MELAIYFTNLERLMNMDDALHYLDVYRDPYSVSLLLVDDPNMLEYYGNLEGLNWMNTIFEKGYDFSRLYFGQEFCQNLIPPVNEIEQSYYMSRQLGWEYTYVTGGYLVESGLAKVRRNLDKLREIADGSIEVVFNDWGVFNILRREYPEFVPVMGRILNKQTRLHMYMETREGLPTLMSDLNTPMEEIKRNQFRAFADISLNNECFHERLKELGVKNVDMDMTHQGILRPEDGWGLTLGFYFPWGFIATGRNCATAATVDPYRTYQVVEEPCSRPCRKYNCTPCITPSELSIMQRGPALMALQTRICEPYFNGSVPYERLIFEPYTPL